MKSYKKILILSFLFFALLLFNNTVNASYIGSDGVTYPDIPSTYTDKDFFIFHANVNISANGLSANTTYLYVFVGEPYCFGEGKYLHVSSYSYLTYYAASDKNYTGRCDVYYLSNNNWVLHKSYYNGGVHYPSCTMLYSTLDIYNSSWSEILFEKYEEPEYVFPYIADTDEVLSNLDNVEDILVFPGSLSKSYLPLKLSIYKYVDDTTIEGVLELSLDTSSAYYLYIVENPDDYWWEIPTELFKNSLQNGQEYHFVLLGANEYNDFSITRSITYQGTTYVPPTDEEIQTDAIKDQTEKIEEQTDAIKDQTEKIEEQTEVQKNIFQRIGEILSYINPLSENFFAYKLIDLLVDALKSLFVPEEGFFNNWIADINDYFSSRFGMVYSSIDFVVDFLTRLADISSNLNTDYTIHIPEFKLFDTTLIPEYSYNLADLLENETFKNIHTIYLCIIDVIMFLWLMLFARNTFAEIFGGKLLDDTFGHILDNSDSVSSMSKRAEKEIKYRGIYSARKSNMQRWHKNKE